MASCVKRSASYWDDPELLALRDWALSKDGRPHMIGIFQRLAAGERINKVLKDAPQRLTRVMFWNLIYITPQLREEYDNIKPTRAVALNESRIDYALETIEQCEDENGKVDVKGKASAVRAFTDVCSEVLPVMSDEFSPLALKTRSNSQNASPMVITQELADALTKKG